MGDRPTVGWWMRTALRLLLACACWLLLSAGYFALSQWLRDAFAPEWLATVLPNWLLGALSLYFSAVDLFDLSVEFDSRLEGADAD
jgi:hypothetical protein